MKRRFIVRVILFTVFALILVIGVAFEDDSQTPSTEETITDNYYKNFFGLADGIAEMKDALVKKFDSIFDFVKTKG